MTLEESDKEKVSYTQGQVKRSVTSLTSLFKSLVIRVNSYRVSQ